MKNTYIQVIKQLDKFTSTFSRIDTLEKMVQYVEEIIEDTFSIEYTGLYLFDESTGRLKLIYAKGFNEEEILDAEQTAMERHPGLVYRSKRMIYIPDTLLDDKNLTLSSKRSVGGRSRLYLPVMNGYQAVGAFGIVDLKPNAYDDEDIAILSFICNLAGAQYANILNQNLLKSANKEILNLSKLPAENPNPILRISHDNILLYANNASKQLLEYHGFKERELVSNVFSDTISVLLSSGKSVEREITDGKSLYSFLFTLVEGTGYINLYGRDITKRKEAEQELIKRTTFQKAILNSAAIAIISTDLNGIVQSFNPAASKMLGYTAEEVIGVMTPLRFHDEMEVRKRFHEMPEQGFCYFGICKTSEVADLQDFKAEINEYAFIRKDGSRFPVSLTVTALLDENSKVTGFLGMAEDITHRKEQYDALQIANLRFRLLISSMQAGVMVEDYQRNVVLVNQCFCDLFSIPIPPEQLVGMNCEDAAEASKGLFVDPETFIRDIDNTLALRQVVINHELQMNSGISLERDFIPIEDLGKKNQGTLWIYRNITQRKNNEKDLLRQSQVLSGTAEAMNYLLTLSDHDQAIQLALEAIGIATGVDRVYIFKNNEDEKTGEAFFSQLYEWTAEGVAPQIDNLELQNIPFSEGFPRWYHLLSSGKPVSGLVRDFPESERQLLEAQDIISLIAVPVFINGHLWGMVGFDDCTKGIQWSKNEASILSALAGSIGGSISRRIIENELVDARQIAEYATKTKSDFLATMSHEIRTPMNGVIGMTSLLLQTQLTSNQRDYTETIRTSGEILLNLINDILDFSKIESGKMVLEVHSFDLEMAIEDVLDLIASAAFEKNLGLYFLIDPAIPKRINGDLTRLRQILVNLVGNAIKFTSEGEVVISVKQIEIQGNEARLEFSVKDTGLGIPEEKIDKLFKPFSQVDASTTRKYGGTGLGLAICATLVKLMDGNIWAKSEVNRGTEFLFTIRTFYPLNEIRNENPISDQQVVTGKNVLIIDANPTSNAMLCTLCKNLKMKPLPVDSAKMALQVINEKADFDIIVIDNDLPGMESSVLASEIKKIKGYNNIPLLLVTHPILKEIGSAIDNNFQARLNKPLKHSQFVQSMTDLLSIRKSAQIQTIVQPKQFQKINEKYPLSILVAEDNTINQKLVLSLFGMLGYTIQIAANGYEVIAALNRMKTDIIFMDIQMPEMDGLEATRQIIATWGDQRPLIVAMTANALISDKEKCLAVGMDDYISKPLTIDQIKTGIEKWALLCNRTGKNSSDPG